MKRSRFHFLPAFLILAFLATLYLPTLVMGDTPAASTFAVKTKTTEPQTVAALAHTGPYDDHMKVIGDLMTWVAKNGLSVVGPVRGVYFNNPADAKPEGLKWEIRVPVIDSDSTVSGNTDPVLKDVPADFVAYTYFKGPFEQAGQAYGPLFTWIGKNGYVPSGPATEIFWSDQGTPKDQLITEIQVPVDKKK